MVNDLDDETPKPRPTLGKAFEHPEFWLVDFSEVPLDRDTYLIDEADIPHYERQWRHTFEGRDFAPEYLVTFVAVRDRRPEALELAWYPNVSTRFHEVGSITLPREAFVCCVQQPRYGGNPAIFVESEWLKDFYGRRHSVFALVDAIGITEVFRSARLSRPQLITLRDRVDEIAARFPEVALVSVADSIILKSQWRPGDVRANQKYDYQPEIVIDAIAEIDRAFQDVLGLRTYAVLVQGANAYYDDQLLHISSTQNHVSLNSLGVPLAQLLEIDAAVRKALHDGVHARFDLYMDTPFLHSLNLQHSFDREALAKGSYKSKMAAGAEHQYYAVDLETIQTNRSDLLAKGK
jgi:hypothetical protein